MRQTAKIPSLSFIKRDDCVFVSFIVFFVVFVTLAVLKILVPLNKLTLDQRYSPILLPMLACLFNLFKKIKLRSAAINALASCSLFVYCFHENILLRTYVRPKFYEYVFSVNPNVYFWWVMLCAVGMFVLGYVVSLVYKFTFSKLTRRGANIVSRLILHISDGVYQKFFCKEEGENFAAEGQNASGEENVR